MVTGLRRQKKPPIKGGNEHRVGRTIDRKTEKNKMKRQDDCAVKRW